MLKRFLICSLVLVFAVSIVEAHPVKRIRFTRGATQATATGILNAYKDKQIFLLRVRSGQTIKIVQLKSNSSRQYITVAIKSPNGEYVGDSDASCNNRKEITPTIAGDYRIEVIQCRKANAWRGRFRLNVEILTPDTFKIANARVLDEEKLAELSGIIKNAEGEYQLDSSNPKTKKSLAKAYFERAFILVEVAQYLAAVGDFRKGLKLDPTNQEAKEMYEQIIGIFKSLGRKLPEEGKEPLPVPTVKKQEEK